MNLKTQALVEHNSAVAKPTTAPATMTTTGTAATAGMPLPTVRRRDEADNYQDIMTAFIEEYQPKIAEVRVIALVSEQKLNAFG
jgi:O-glycosyl hydrolase